MHVVIHRNKVNQRGNGSKWNQFQPSDCWRWIAQNLFRAFVTEIRSMDVGTSASNGYRVDQPFEVIVPIEKEPMRINGATIPQMREHSNSQRAQFLPR